MKNLQKRLNYWKSEFSRLALKEARTPTTDWKLKKEYEQMKKEAFFFMTVLAKAIRDKE